MRKLLYLMLGLAASASAGLRPVEECVDFGEIDEAKGLATLRTYVVNDGDTPVTITNARTTCGCTRVGYPDDVIAPGDTAWVDITYDPVGRFGDFHKSIRLYTNEGEKVPVEFIGTIRSTEETVARRYPYKAGPLRLSETKVLSGKLFPGEQRTLFVNFYNMSDHYVVPEATVEGSDAVSVSVGPSPVGARSVGSIAILPNSTKPLPPGLHHLEVKLNPNVRDPESEIETIEVLIEIE